MNIVYLVFGLYLLSAVISSIIVWHTIGRYDPEFPLNIFTTLLTGLIWPAEIFFILRDKNKIKDAIADPEFEKWYASLSDDGAEAEDIKLPIITSETAISAPGGKIEAHVVSSDTCVCCGTYVPEGIQVCKQCWDKNEVV